MYGGMLILPNKYDILCIITCCVLQNKKRHKYHILVTFLKQFNLFFKKCKYPRQLNYFNIDVNTEK
jgi:hypothetical protein